MPVPCQCRFCQPGLHLCCTASALPTLASQLALLLQTYPVVTVTPDGGVVVAAGKTLVKYSRNGDRFSKQFSYANRPGAPWSYPQTGVGLPLPLKPPYDRCVGRWLQPACLPCLRAGVPHSSPHALPCCALPQLCSYPWNLMPPRMTNL